MLAFPHIVRAEPPTDTEVVMIGAGAAGLAAARVLMKLAIPFRLIEARNRIGGRALTDIDTFGVPVDFGCSELHNFRLNPWLGYARQNGIRVEPLPSRQTVFDGSRQLSATELAELGGTFQKLQHAIRAACAARRDIAVSDVLRQAGDGEWMPSFRLWLGPISAGIDLDNWSLHDWCAGRSGENWFAPAGFGALIGHFGRNIPVSLNTEATAIRWSNRSVEVLTDRGTVTARAVIVTVPASVLKSGALRFTPALPDWKQAALDGLETAYYTKVLLKFRRDPFDLPHGSWAAPKVEGLQGFSFWLNPGGHGVTQAMAGGRHALDLELAGSDVAVDAALSSLRSIAGSGIEQTFEHGTATVWAQDPYALGAWVQARPGHANARNNLLAPLEDRVFFAGDTCHDLTPATAGGAGIVGDMVARAVARTLGRDVPND